MKGKTNMRTLTKLIGAISLILLATMFLKSRLFLAGKDQVENVINEVTPPEGDFLHISIELGAARDDIATSKANLKEIELTIQDRIKERNLLNKALKEHKSNINAGIEKLSTTNGPEIEHRGETYPRTKLVSFLEEERDRHALLKHERDNFDAEIDEYMLIAKEENNIINEYEKQILTHEQELSSLTKRHERNKVLKRFHKTARKPRDKDALEYKMRQAREKINKESYKYKYNRLNPKFDFRKPEPESVVLDKIRKSIGN